MKDIDKPAHKDFCTQMQTMLEEDRFDDCLVFSDEATFHLTGKVNKHNTCIWGTEHPHSMLEHVQDSPKVNVFCTISKRRVYGPFFFKGTTVNSKAYLDMLAYFDMLQNWLMELLFDREEADFNFQQDAAPPHWSLIVRQYLNTTLHSRWIGCAGNDDCVLLHKSPDLTPCDFVFWGYVKGLVYIPPLPTSLDDLKTWITEALITIIPDMLVRVWQEMEYHFNVCHVTKGLHIEHL